MNAKEWNIRTTRIRPRRWEHRQHQPKGQPQHRNNSNWPAHKSRIELARSEALLAPDQAAEDGRCPCDVVTGHEEREKCVRCDGVDEAE